MRKYWRISGQLMGAATLVFALSLLFNLHYFYVDTHPDYGNYYYSNDGYYYDDYGYYTDDDDLEMTTYAEQCDIFARDPICYTVGNEKFSLLGAGLVSAGLAIICFAKQDEVDREASSSATQRAPTQNQQPAPITIQVKPK